MKLSIMLRTATFRGDHETELCVAQEVLPGETVEQLAARLFCDRTLAQGPGYAPIREHEVIEIRAIAVVADQR